MVHLIILAKFVFRIYHHFAHLFKLSIRLKESIWQYIYQALILGLAELFKLIPNSDRR